MKKEDYKLIKIEPYAKTPWQRFVQVIKRTLRVELFKGMGIVFGRMKEIHTTQYPKEKLPLGPRYRAVHELMRLLESGNEACIGCGLCEKICISKCIRMDTTIGEDGRKRVTEYSINFGRCIFCGYCAEVCPELAIVHGPRYENASEQRAHFGLKEDILTPIDLFKAGRQSEFTGFGACNTNADERLTPTPLAY
ncbi:MAG: NADH-quinone oxidoreductase subunit NuoI [Campylobacterales bacterium]